MEAVLACFVNFPRETRGGGGSLNRGVCSGFEAGIVEALDRELVEVYVWSYYYPPFV